MSEENVIRALQNAVKSAVAASSVPALPIHFIGINFAVPNDSKYLEIVQIINNVTDQFWGDERTRQGLLRLILHWPLNGTGVYSPTSILDQIESFFKKDKMFVHNETIVKIYDVPRQLGQIVSGAEQLFPLSVPYRS